MSVYKFVLISLLVNIASCIPSVVDKTRLSTYGNNIEQCYDCYDENVLIEPNFDPQTAVDTIAQKMNVNVSSSWEKFEVPPMTSGVLGTFPLNPNQPENIKSFVNNLVPPTFDTAFITKDWIVKSVLNMSLNNYSGYAAKNSIDSKNTFVRVWNIGFAFVRIESVLVEFSVFSLNTVANMYNMTFDVSNLDHIYDTLTLFNYDYYEKYV